MSTGTVSRRGLGLIVALALAAFATMTWVSYVRSIENKAIKGSSVVKVLIAKESIPAGTSGDFAASKGLFEVASVPRRILAEGAVTNAATLRGRLASTTIVKGEQIVSTRFVSAEQAGRLLNIPADKHAIAVQVDAPPGVAGFIQPKDHVSIIAKIEIRNAAGTGAGAGNNLAQVRFLMQDVEVLAVGKETTVKPPPSSGARQDARDAQEAATPAQERLLMTLAVTPAQAEQLAFAVMEGEIYFTLLPVGSKPATTSGRTSDTLYR